MIFSVHFQKTCRYVLLAGATVLLLPACKTTEQGLGSDPYVTNDGGYNPYPGAGGQASRESLLPPSAAPRSSSGAGGYVPQYEQAVPAPPPGFDLPGDGGSFKESPAPKRGTASTSKPSSTTTAKKTTSSSTKKPTTVAKKKPSSAGKIHTVVKGDTLYGLALKNKTTVAKIKALNGLKSDMLSIGKKLKMP
jgi:hypothetical protein